jgi:hypothetical protein
VKDREGEFDEVSVCKIEDIEDGQIWAIKCLEAVTSGAVWGTAAVGDLRLPGEKVAPKFTNAATSEHST